MSEEELAHEIHGLVVVSLCVLCNLRSFAIELVLGRRLLDLIVVEEAVELGRGSNIRLPIHQHH